ncbi:MAG: DUF2142 domain-containing protein [Lactobacillales bacterium]|nr:DUF2142 domain-containing protein [Lactobacillales bacterium]
MLNRVKLYYKKPECIFLGLALIFGVLSLIMMPMYGVPDEPAHFSAAHHFAFGGYRAPKNLWIDKNHPMFIFQKILEPVSDVLVQVKRINFAPIPYIPQMIGLIGAKLFLPTVGGYYLFGRLFNLLFYIIVIFFVIKKVNVGKWVFTTIALFPTSLMLAASFSYDASTYSITFALFAVVLNMFTSDKVTNKHRLFLYLCIFWLASFKTNYILVAAPLLFISSTKFKKNKKKVFFNIDKWVTGFGCIVFAFLGTRMLSSTPTLTQQGGGTITIKHFMHILFNTYVVDFSPTGFSDYADQLICQVFGIFASFDYSLPKLFVLILFSILLFSFLIDDCKIKIPKPLIVSSMIVFFGELVLVANFMYFNWGIPLAGPGVRNAEGVQGRYFAPLIPLFIPFFLWFSNTKVGLRLKNEYVMSTLVTSSTMLCCGLYVLMTWWYYYHLGLKVRC